MRREASASSPLSSCCHGLRTNLYSCQVLGGRAAGPEDSHLGGDTLALPDALVIHQPLALVEQRYSYHEVVAIRRSTQFSPSPERVAQSDHPLYVVEFADGRRWSTRWEPGDRDPGLLAALVDYIAQESGVPVQDRPVLYASVL